MLTNDVRTGHLAWKNSVELRGFEPLTPSMRTQRAHRQSRCCATFLHVSDVEPGTVTASDRT
jgi:hypothetical protein